MGHSTDPGVGQDVYCGVEYLDAPGGIRRHQKLHRIRGNGVTESADQGSYEIQSSRAVFAICPGVGQNRVNCSAVSVESANSSMPVPATTVSRRARKSSSAIIGTPSSPA